MQKETNLAVHRRRPISPDALQTPGVPYASFTTIPTRLQTTHRKTVAGRAIDHALASIPTLAPRPRRTWPESYKAFHTRMTQSDSVLNAPAVYTATRAPQPNLPQTTKLYPQHTHRLTRNAHTQSVPKAKQLTIRPDERPQLPRQRVPPTTIIHHPYATQALTRDATHHSRRNYSLHLTDRRFRHWQAKSSTHRYDILPSPNWSRLGQKLSCTSPDQKR